MNNKRFWKFNNSTNKLGELYIYGEIVSSKLEDTDVTAIDFKKDLESLGNIEKLNIYINSPGGSVFEGITIYNILRRHKAYISVYVDALAASIASVIAMAADKIVMPKNSMLMIHNPWTFAIGNAKELRKQADDLDRIGGSAVESYLQKAGDKLTEKKLHEMLDAETWLSADEAFNYGLCDVVQEENRMVAIISKDMFSKYKNVPKHLISQQHQITTDELTWRKQIQEQSSKNLESLDTQMILLESDLLIGNFNNN